MNTTAPTAPAPRCDAPALDTTTELARTISTQLGPTGVKHQVIAASDGIVVRGPYGDAVTVCGSGDTYHLVAADGREIDTRVRLDDPAELLGLVLVFHALWSMNRVARAGGAVRTLAEHPGLAGHTAMLLAHLGMLTTSPESLVALRARTALDEIRVMLAA